MVQLFGLGRSFNWSVTLSTTDLSPYSTQQDSGPVPLFYCDNGPVPLFYCPYSTETVR